MSNYFTINSDAPYYTVVSDPTYMKPSGLGLETLEKMTALCKNVNLSSDEIKTLSEYGEIIQKKVLAKEYEICRFVCRLLGITTYFDEIRNIYSEFQISLHNQQANFNILPPEVQKHIITHLNHSNLREYINFSGVSKSCMNLAYNIFIERCKNYGFTGNIFKEALNYYDELINAMGILITKKVVDPYYEDKEDELDLVDVLDYRKTLSELGMNLEKVIDHLTQIGAVTPTSSRYDYSLYNSLISYLLYFAKENRHLNFSVLDYNLRLVIEHGTNDLCKLALMFMPDASKIVKRDLLMNRGLMLSASEGRQDLIETFLGHGAEQNFQNNWGCTALMQACKNTTNLPTLLTLLKDAPDTNADLQDIKGNTALMHLVRRESKYICSGSKIPDESKSILEELLKKVKNINLQNHKGETALMLNSGCESDINGWGLPLLLKYGADPFIRNNDGYTARQLCSEPWQAYWYLNQAEERTFLQYLFQWRIIDTLIEKIVRP